MDLSEVERIEKTTAHPKLSHAMRAGAKLRPQCFEWFYADGKSCALGAAMEGAGILFECGGISRLVERFHVPDTILTGITFRNDVLRITREEIADWLESQGY